MWDVRKKGMKCCAVTSKFWHLVALPEQQGLQFSRRIWHRSKMIIHSTCQRFQKKIQVHSHNKRGTAYWEHWDVSQWELWRVILCQTEVSWQICQNQNDIPATAFLVDENKKKRCAHAASVSLCLLARKYFPHIIWNNHKNAKQINLYCCNLCQFYWVCESFLTFCAWI